MIDRRLRVDALLPRSASVIEGFRRSPELTPDDSPVIVLAAALALHHDQQWSAENDSRAARDPHDVAHVKRLIDELNTRRLAMVERIDRWAAREIDVRSEASLHTETLGSVIDRLAIAWVRTQRLIKAVDADRDLARQALRQLAELADAYDDLVRDLASGQRRLPVWRPLKYYGVDE